MMLTESLAGAWRASVPNPLLAGHAQASAPHRLFQRFTMARRFLTTYYQCQRQPDQFRSVRTVCAFLGHGRSGSTVVAALLDAHRHVILADRISLVGYLSAGFRREQLFRILLQNSGFVTSRGRQKGGRDGRTYSYAVPGQWQGRYEDLQVIGSRNAGPFTRRIGDDPRLLDLLQQSMEGLSLRFIQVVRNPFDVISTMFIRSGRELMDGIRAYFTRCEAINRVEEQMGSSAILRVRHEDLLNQPRPSLIGMCDFLGLDTPDDYLDACSSILYKSPVATRSKVAWTPDLIQEVHHRIQEFPFLKGYSFDT